MKNQDLVLELMAMRDVGMSVSDRAIAEASKADLSEYEAISVSDLASLFCELYPETRS